MNFVCVNKYHTFKSAFTKDYDEFGLLSMELCIVWGLNVD